ncbi:hypothetical protein [Sulfuricurvum sp.]|uniref:hypothetical protein n=1 Tax=Sulfuricurvum sp. TaxID=2025608 RepID=UPI003567F1B5
MKIDKATISEHQIHKNPNDVLYKHIIKVEFFATEASLPELSDIVQDGKMIDISILISGDKIVEVAILPKKKRGKKE